MNQLNHTNLIKLYDAVEQPNKGITIIMEHLSGGELLSRIAQDDYEPTEMDIIEYMKQLCEGCKYMHSKNIIHLDLKPENIICCDLWSNHIKIIDFGLAKIYDPHRDVQTMMGTAEFSAPEILCYEPVTFATDMWSLGVILFILLSGMSPFLGDTEEETVKNITETDIDYPEEFFGVVSEDGMDFLERLIQDEQEDRMTAKECLRHEWLSDTGAERLQKLKRKHQDNES